MMQIPRVELVEMGPSMDLTLRRLRPAGQDMEHEAMARAKTTKKKVSCPSMHCAWLLSAPQPREWTLYTALRASDCLRRVPWQDLRLSL